MADPIEVWRRLDEARQRQDLSAAVGFFAEDAVLEFPGGPFKGREAIRSFFERQREAIPDAKPVVLTQAVSGQNVMTEFSQTGTHTGPVRSPGGEIPPTGKRVTIKGVHVVEVEGDLVKSMRFYVDTMSFLSQLGVAPASRGVGSAASTE